MAMIEEFEAAGNSLFKGRSYFPILAFLIIAGALPYYHYPWGRHSLALGWEGLCLAMAFFGMFIRAMTIGYVPKRTSGRNTKKGQIADVLNTGGMYSICRNPLYLGNFLIGFAFSIFFRVWWISFIYVLLFALYYERIIFAEEAFLRKKFGEDYMDWASKTPTFFPGFSLWRSPELCFSLKKVLRKEYHGFLSIVIGMFAMEVAVELYLWHTYKLALMWEIILSVALLAYIVIRILHKKTYLLKTEGR